MERIDKVQNLIPEKPEFVHSNQEKGEAIESLKIVNRPVVKKDAAALVTGKSVYTNDLAPSDCLIVKVIRSPYAHALIKDINTARAEAVPGIECVLTYKDCPDKRFTMAGQTYPEPSPYDRLILDQRVRFVGDAAAIVAGTSDEAVKKAMKLVKIQYEVLNRYLISVQQRIIQSLCIRKITGEASARLAQTTREISVHMMYVEMET